MTLQVTTLILPVTDMPAQAAFYERVLGLPVVAGSVIDGNVAFGTENLRITMKRRALDAPKASVMTLVFGTPQLDELHATLVKAGTHIGPIVSNGPQHQAEGTDPEGNHFIIASLPHIAAHAPAPRMDLNSTMVWDTPVDLPTPSFTFVDPTLTSEVQQALTANPDVFIQTLQGATGLAVIFRDLLTRLNHARQEPIEDWELEVVLKNLGGIGMMATVGKRHRRIVVFEANRLHLAPTKHPLPQPLELASRATYPLGVGN